MDASHARPATTHNRNRKAKPAPLPRRKYQSPNFFVGFRIENPEIVANVMRLQERIAERFPEVACCVIDARTLHVTLCTLHLATEDDIQQAMRILEENAYPDGEPAFGDDAPSFDFRGVDFFGKNFILYSPLDVTSRFADTLEEMAETLHTAFDSLELTTGPFKKPYAPHITIWKTTKFIGYIKGLNKTRATPIEYELGDYLSQSEPEHFGTETPTSVELLSMREKEPDGYYKVYHSARLVTAEPATEREDGSTDAVTEKLPEIAAVEGVMP